MKVACLQNTTTVLTKPYNKTITHRLHLSIGSYYWVYGIAIINNNLNYLILDDLFDPKRPSWYEARLFSKTPSNASLWYFDYRPQQYLKALFSYKELVQTFHHDNLLEREEDDLNLFALRKQQIEINSMIPWHWKKRALQTKQGLSMKATCISNTAQNLTVELCEKLSFEPTSSFNLSIGNRYIIYGMHAWHDTVFYLLVGDDTQSPCLYPADLFTLVDHLIPIEWYFNYTEQNGPLWGYKELALDTPHLDQLLQQEPAALKIFEARKTEIDEWERLP